MEEDPFGFIDAYCHCSSSQEELMKNSLYAREDSSPEPYSPPPSAAFEENGIFICSAPETPSGETVASPSGDEFKTPPEESHRSSSEEAPPTPQMLSSSESGEIDGGHATAAVKAECGVLSGPDVGFSQGGEIDDGHETAAVKTDCGILDGGTPDLWFSQGGEIDGGHAAVKTDCGVLDGGTPAQEGNRTPKMVEILSDGKVRVREVSKFDLEPISVGEKRGRPTQEPSPSKRIRVSVESSVSVTTPNQEAREEGQGLEKMKLEYPIEIGVNVKMDVETEVFDVDSALGEAVDTEVIEDYEVGGQDCANNGGVLNVQQEQEDKEEEEEERTDNGNVNRERETEVIDVDSAIDKAIDTEVFEDYEFGEGCANNGGVLNVQQEQEDKKGGTENGNENRERETEVIDVDSAVDKAIDTEVIDDCVIGGEDCANNGGVLNVQQEQEDKEEEGRENGNENRERETVGNDADDPSRQGQGRRGLPPSWACRNRSNNREDENHSNTERASGNAMGVVMEVLRWLAREERQNHDHEGPVDFLETAKRRGVKFPEPKWWHDNEDRL